MRADEAGKTYEFLDGFSKLTEASKVRARDPSSFEEFVRSATEDTAVENVFLDPQVLAQSGKAEQLAAISPAVAEQYAAALDAGIDIRIPTSEYATNIAGTEYNQGLIEHLKTDENGMTKAQADDFMATKGEVLQAEITRVLGERMGDDEFMQSSQVVEERVFQELQ